MSRTYYTLVITPRSTGNTLEPAERLRAIVNALANSLGVQPRYLKAVRCALVGEALPYLGIKVGRNPTGTPSLEPKDVLNRCRWALGTYANDVRLADQQGDHMVCDSKRVIFWGTNFVRANNEAVRAECKAHRLANKPGRDETPEQREDRLAKERIRLEKVSEEKTLARASLDEYVARVKAARAEKRARRA